jgi:CHAT domain
VSRRGVASVAPVEELGLLIPIVVEEDEYRVGTAKFDRGPEQDDVRLLEFTAQVLAVFQRIEDAVLDAGSVDLEPGFRDRCLQDLAKWGSRAFKHLFHSADARAALAVELDMRAASQTPARPTFISQRVPFPWEVLYDGDDYEYPEPDGFWGLRLAPARVLDGRNVWSHVPEQPLPSDMLFCLHAKLREAHEHERPWIEKAVCSSADDRFAMLSGGLLGAKLSGRRLLRYLDAADHTMVHFACHCRSGDAGGDVLEISVLADANGGDTALLELETYAFGDDAEQGGFSCMPLVFLNACQSAGRPDVLRNVLNLPSSFVARGAGAVVGTACPVPDLFAAQFARAFYERFLAAEGGPRLAIAQALRDTRRQFVDEHRNPLGLAYGLYSPGHYRIAAPPAAGGLAP